MFVKINSCANIGLNCERVEVESDISPRQQTAFIIVGLPDAAIQEARERVRLAIENSGLEFPRARVTVNLAPADLKKEGPAYDLAMAIGILKSQEIIHADMNDSLFFGELALNGETRATNGILLTTLFAQKKGIKNLYIPKANAREAALISSINIFPVGNLRQLIDHLNNLKQIKPLTVAPWPDFNDELNNVTSDLAQVCGQEQAKRALEIAAAGAHNLLFNGPPGSGKTLLARCLPSILPKLTTEEILEVTKIYSVAGLLPPDQPIIQQRPFRTPHHTSSGVALVGGGKFPRPGEISLAHRGVLFLDEFPEFPRTVLENLRQPLEDGVISISRAQSTLTFPARFTLVASQNPCPCGYYSDPEKECTCSPNQILKYQKRISGPILDRIDLHVEVPRIKFEKLQSAGINESSAVVRERVARARARQKKRFQQLDIKTNAEMRPNEIKNFCQLDNASIDLLKSASQRMHFSGRTIHRLLKVCRTIADLETAESITLNHLAEALQYRPKEK